MAVFSILAVALLYRGASAQCTGAYIAGFPFPLDVCLTSSASGVATSQIYSCEGDTGSIMNYAEADCAGTGTEDTISVAFFTFVCGDAGESCDYAVTRTYVNDSTGACLDDYAETAIFMDQGGSGPCLDLSAQGGSGSTDYTCTDTAITAEVYMSADCSGTAISSQTTTDNPCVEVLSCNSGTDDGTDDGTDPDEPTDTPSPTQMPDDSDSTSAPTKAPTPSVCKGVKQANAEKAQIPLDVCTNSYTPVGQHSTNRVCENGVGYEIYYYAPDCSDEEGEDRTLLADSGLTAICEGVDCDYTVAREYIGENECQNDGGDYPWYVEAAVIVNSCFDFPDGGSGRATCTLTSTTSSLYSDEMCSTVIQSDIVTFEDDCFKVVECTLFNNSNAATFLLATVYFVICASMAL